MINRIIPILLILVSICIIYFNYNIKNNNIENNNIENFTTFEESDNSYCLPGSGTTSSNIGEYQSISEAQAKEQCEINPQCKGITFNKKTNKYILKKELTGNSNYNEDYSCLKKITQTNNSSNVNNVPYNPPNVNNVPYNPPNVNNVPYNPPNVNNVPYNPPISLTENLSGLDSNTLSAIKQEINRQYNMDIEAIRNLGAISKSLLTGKNYHNVSTGTPGTLTIPGDVKILGKLDIDNNLIVNSNNFNILPKGMIMAWAYTDIPSGWAKCDGQNGTPDLRSRFILGEGNGGGLSNRPRNQRGGSETHRLTVDQMPAHSHRHHVYTRARVNDTADGNEPGDDPHHWRFDGRTENTGGNQAHNNMPPYHVLIYIMKL